MITSDYKQGLSIRGAVVDILSESFAEGKGVFLLEVAVEESERVVGKGVAIECVLAAYFAACDEVAWGVDRRWEADWVLC